MDRSVHVVGDGPAPGERVRGRVSDRAEEPKRQSAPAVPHLALLRNRSEEVVEVLERTGNPGKVLAVDAHGKSRNKTDPTAVASIEPLRPTTIHTPAHARAQMPPSPS